MKWYLQISKTKKLREKVLQCPSLFLIQTEISFRNPRRETAKRIKSWYTCSTLNRADIYVVSPEVRDYFIWRSRGLILRSICYFGDKVKYRQNHWLHWMTELFEMGIRLATENGLKLLHVNNNSIPISVVGFD